MLLIKGIVIELILDTFLMSLSEFFDRVSVGTHFLYVLVHNIDIRIRFAVRLIKFLTLVASRWEQTSVFSQVVSRESVKMLLGVRLVMFSVMENNL